MKKAKKKNNNSFDLDMDLNFDFDEEQEESFDSINQLDIHAIVLESKSKEKINYKLEKGVIQIGHLISNVEKGKEYRFISGGKGFGSISFIDYVSKKYGCIKQLYVSTLAVGKKHIEHLNKLNIEKATFVFNNLFEESKIINEYSYFNVFKNICDKRKWKYFCLKNHSKIILMQTENNYFVLETSSNLNENPKIEQFIFQEDEELYKWYQVFFEGVEEE